MPRLHAPDQAKIALLREDVVAWKFQPGLGMRRDVGCRRNNYVQCVQSS